MNLLQLTDEQIINLDHVVEIRILDIPDNKGNIKWVLMFQLDLIDLTRSFPNSMDEDEHNTAYSKSTEYAYATEISPFYETLKDAQTVMNRIVYNFTKKEKTK